MPAKEEKKSKTVREIGEDGRKKLDKLIEELKDAEEIINEIGISRPALQTYIGRKQHEDEKLYKVPNLYKAKGSSYMPKPITWSDKRGIMIGAGRISEEARKDFKDGDTTFEVSVKAGKIILTPNK